MKTINKIFFLFVLSSFISCEDIIEENINDQTVQITFPLNNATIESNVVNFQWNKLKGADKYRIQVFTTNQNMILDSLVSQTNLIYPLNQNSYQWRVRGENFAYSSAYSTDNSFSVIETTNLNNQVVILQNPAAAFYTNNSSIIFSWASLSAAQSYSFELINVTNGNTIVNQQNNLTTTSLSISSNIINNDAEYQWKVKGVNASSETVFSTRNFYIDKVSPNSPINSLPNNNQIVTINAPINFTWNSAVDNGVIQSPVTYLIQFSNTLDFSTVLQSSDLTTNTFQQNFTTSGDYFWRVKAIDQAGNSSGFSVPFKMTVN